MSRYAHQPALRRTVRDILPSCTLYSISKKKVYSSSAHTLLVLNVPQARQIEQGGNSIKGIMRVRRWIHGLALNTEAERLAFKLLAPKIPLLSRGTATVVPMLKHYFECHLVVYETCRETWRNRVPVERY